MPPGNPYALNSSIPLTDLPLRQRPAADQEAGFGAVEFWRPLPGRSSSNPPRERRGATASPEENA